MEFLRIEKNDLPELFALQKAYKAEIGEDCPTEGDLEALAAAIGDGRILFYGCKADGRLVGCCSVSVTFSTFNYAKSGVFEDFYILPGSRHKGIARKLTRFAFEQSGVKSLTVGCADCDVEMYRAIGFGIPLGNLLAYDAEE